MSTNAEMAARMYPSMAQPAQEAASGSATTLINQPVADAAPQAAKPASEPPAPAPATLVADPVQEAKTKEEALTDALYPKAEPLPKPDIPAHIKELRDSDPLRQMYSAQTSYQGAIPDNVFDGAEGLDPVQVKMAVAELREISNDLGLAPADVKELQQRATLIRNTAPSAAEQQAEAVRGLNAAFGNDATSALRDARALLQRDPRTAKMIEAMGLGNDPRTVVLIAQAARRERGKGRLK